MYYDLYKFIYTKFCRLKNILLQNYNEHYTNICIQIYTFKTTPCF